MHRSVQFQIRFLIALLLLVVTPGLCLAGPSKPIPFEPDDTLEEIREKIELNGYSFTVAHNRIFDMSPEEKENFLSRRPPQFYESLPESEDPGPLVREAVRPLLSEFDWRDFGGHAYIGPIRNQGSCGSCYAFGACAAAEGVYNFAMGRYDDNCADFSESFIMWCLGSISPYSSHFYGCNGADYDYYELLALTNEGVVSEEDFPYTTRKTQCLSWGDEATVFNSWHRIACGDIDAIKAAIITYGVIDVAVYVTSAFQSYSGGIYEDTNTTCGSDPCYYTPTNHAVALVGWDDNPPEGGGGCWILRNSWGESWGESGYMRIRYTSAVVSCEAAYLTPAPWPRAFGVSASNIDSDSATLNGVVNPNGQDTGYFFQYGTTAAYGLTTSIESAGSGAADVPVSAPVVGLSSSTTYHYRLGASNAYGTTYSDDATFVTDVGPQLAPTATTGTASLITTSSATVSGTVNPNNLATTYYFQYGLTTAYGSTTTSASAGSGGSDVPVSTSISGLAAGTTYHFRLVAQNAIGTTYGNDATFATLALSPPTATTGSASLITSSSARVSGAVNPNGVDTIWYFQYGKTTAYGSKTSNVNAGSGSSAVSVSASLSGLSAETTYHFRLVAQSAAGTTYGNDASLTTLAAETSDDGDGGGGGGGGCFIDAASQ